MCVTVAFVFDPQPYWVQHVPHVLFVTLEVDYFWPTVPQHMGLLGWDILCTSLPCIFITIWRKSTV
eukprot:5881301-Amphidinium_carterae.1